MGYLVYIVLIVIAIIFNEISSFKKSVLPTAIICVILFVVAVLRTNIGADYEMYTDMYVRVANLSDFSDTFTVTEPLYFLLIKFGSYFVDSYHTLFISTALLIYILLYFTVVRLSIKPSLSVLLYVITTYYFISINQLRQSVSLSLFLYSLIYVIKKPSTLKYYIINIIGFGFHFSAIIPLIFYPLIKLNLSKKKLLILIALSVILSPIIEKVFFDYFFALDTVYSKYMNLDEFTSKNYLAIVKLVIPNILILLTLHFYKYFNTEGEKKLINIIAFGVIYFNVFFGKSVFIRPGMYFEIALIIFIPLFIKKFNSIKYQYLITYTLVLYYFCLTYFGIFLGGGQGVVPYKFIFE